MSDWLYLGGLSRFAKRKRNGCGLRKFEIIRHVLFSLR